MAWRRRVVPITAVAASTPWDGFALTLGRGGVAFRTTTGGSSSSIRTTRGNPTSGAKGGTSGASNTPGKTRNATIAPTTTAATLPTPLQ
ncbi:MAG: hypothetical protein JJE35_07185 [Thermoleophilia bacterium]|nr:hypothetical protein [Thermoleophilia bacterium]